MFTTNNEISDRFVANQFNELSLFKRLVLLKIKERHDEFLTKAARRFCYELNINWHSEFDQE